MRAIFTEVWEFHTAKVTFKVTQGQCLWYQSIRHYDFLLVFHCKYVLFRYTVS